MLCGSKALIALVKAVLLCALMASLAQTQCNLHFLAELGLEVDLATRLRTSGQDLLGFAPVFALLALVAYSAALPVAHQLRRLLPVPPWLIFSAAGGAGLWFALAVTNFVAPVPTFIAADRFWPGTLAMSLSGALGAWVFYLSASGRGASA